MYSFNVRIFLFIYFFFCLFVLFCIVFFVFFFFFVVVVVFIPCHTIVVGYIIVSRWTSVCLSVRPVSRSHVRPSVYPVRFSFPDDNLSKHQWIFTKLSICIDIVEIWFGIANGQILPIFYGVICPRHAHIFVFRTII